jgi:hypothetical protein
MNLEERLHARDVLLGDGARRRDLAELLASQDPDVVALAAAVWPLLDELDATVNRLAPLGTPEEAVLYMLGHATGFRADAVAEFCGASEQSGGDPIDEIRRC